MHWPKTRRGRILAVIAVAAILAAVGPSFTYVRVKGNGQDIEVRRRLRPAAHARPHRRCHRRILGD